LFTEEEQKWDQVIDPSELDFHHPSFGEFQIGSVHDVNTERHSYVE